jgi:hypothetical protein
MLLSILKDVREGTVISAGFVTVNDDGSVGTGWAYGDCDTFHQMQSGALTLLRRIGDES